MKKILTVRVWVLIIVLALSIIAINPSPGAKGVEIKNVEPGSPAALAGIHSGERVVSINRQEISALGEYNSVINSLNFKEINLTITTNKGTFTFPSTGDLGFIHQNLTVTDISTGIRDNPLEKGMVIQAVNGKSVSTPEEINAIKKQLFEEKAFVLRTNKDEYALLITAPPRITVGEAKKSNINKGLELQGGTRVLLKPVSDEEITDNSIIDLIAVLNNRLNVYGVSDIKIRPANDLAGNKFVLIEIAGATREEVREIIAKQGKFEAKVGDDVVFEGGKRDIPFVCRNDGSCAGIRPPCQKLEQGLYSCTFQFAITLTQSAAERHAQITKDLGVNASASGSFYLEKQLDLYLDDKLVDSLNIGSDLKGKPITQIAISGPGYGPTEEAAYDDAIENMNRLQTVLITGSLPFKLEIAKLDTISPILGQEFLKNSIIVGIAALLAVAITIVIRYRELKVSIPIIIISLSEVLITLGVAALIGWNMDLASIAGIIAAVGTGVDDQIVITDEVLRGRNEKFGNWKERIKRAFTIVFVAYAATVAAMIPLWSAGAGLVRGFAVTTIIGVTIGVFITRPAFASLVQSLLEK